MFVLFFTVLVRGFSQLSGYDYIDDCGVPDGGNIACGDCFGAPYGPAKYDECGVCDGGGERMCGGTCFLDGCKDENDRPPLLLSERVLFGDICAEHDSYCCYLRADTRVFKLNESNTQTYSIEARPPLVTEPINFEPTCFNKCDANFTACIELGEVKPLNPYPPCIFSETRDRITMYNNAQGWQLFGELTEDTPECMNVKVNGVDFGDFRFINIHAYMFDGHWPGVGALYANGFARLVTFGPDDDYCDPPTVCFGSSFILGPTILLPQPRNMMTMPDLHVVITSIEFTVLDGPVPFTFVAVGYYAHRTMGKVFDVVWTVEAEYPTQQSFRWNVNQKATPPNLNFQKIFAFSVVGISSMYANEDVHDASSTLIKHHPFSYRTMKASRIRHQDVHTIFSYEDITDLDVSLVTDIPTNHNLGAPDLGIFNVQIQGLEAIHGTGMTFGDGF